VIVNTKKKDLLAMEMVRRAAADLVRGGFTSHPRSLDKETAELYGWLRRDDRMAFETMCSMAPNLVHYCGWRRENVELLIRALDMKCCHLEDAHFVCGFKVVCDV